MGNATFNAGIDYFGLETSSSNKLAVKSSSENRSKQSANGSNTYSDIRVVDSWGDTAAPSADYDIIAELTDASMPKGGAIIASMIGNIPGCFGGISITTQKATPPRLTAKGQLLYTGASQLREYPWFAFKISPRHKAQNFVCTKSGTGSSVVYTPIIEVKKGNSAASDSDDFGWENVTADAPIEFTLAQPKGVTKNYDLHGGVVTVQYSLNWYASTEPTISLSSAAVTAGYTMSNPVSKADPEGGYTNYTWTVTLPMVGSEHTST